MKVDKQSQKNIELYSFDIFDTLVTRRTAEPEGIFTVMQHKLKDYKNISDFLKNNFYRIRTEAEAFARFAQLIIQNTEEIKLDNIYELIQYNYNISSETIKNLKNLEIQTELENLILIKQNLKILKDVVNANKKVILISDMYYSSQVIKDILCSLDPIFENIKIYVSCEYNVSKSNGKIFEIIKRNENIQYKNWQHYGDNKHSDIKNAQRFGIKTVYLEAERLMPYEKYLLKKQKYNAFFQAIIGSAKLARISKNEIPSLKVFDFGASFAGPILYNFVDWVINFAKSKNIKNLYFIARDGYIPKIIADIIIEKQKLNIKTKYLYGSRIAWRIPNNETYNEFINSILLEEYSNKININFLSYRLGIPSQTLAKLLNISSCKKILKRKERLIIAKKLQTNITIKTKITKILNCKKELVKDYFKQEIDLNEKDILFVDLHGSGKTQDHVSAYLNEITDCNVYSLYLTNCLGKQKKKSKKMSYLSTANYLSHWIELLARCPQGQTIGYKKSKKGIIPITESINSEKLIKWGFESYINGIKSFCNYMIEFEEKNHLNCNTTDLYCNYFTYFTKYLDYETANIVGDIPYLAIGNEKKITKCADAISLPKAIIQFILCKQENSVNEFNYISIARSNKLSQKFQKAIEKFPTLQKFLFNLYCNKRKEIAYLRILGIKISLNKFFRKANK